MLYDMACVCSYVFAYVLFVWVGIFFCVFVFVLFVCVLVCV